MYSENYPIVTREQKYWKQYSHLSDNIATNKGFTLLYIGENKHSFDISNCFKSEIFTENYAQAQRLIESMSSKAMPDVIFIDLSLNKHEFTAFHSFLEGHKILHKAVLIYNENKLDSFQIQFLKQKQLIDDVVRIDSSSINYCSKISFLKKTKSYQNNPLVKINRQENMNEMMKSEIFSFKRLIDIIGSSIAILLLLPVFIIIAVAVMMESRGPVFYNAVRAGRGFRIFKFYKFRTMHVNADQMIEQVAHLNQYTDSKDGAMFLKIQNDPRITKVGKFLRNTSLDELPQLFNVLKGDMSLVGNRPLPLYEATTLTTNEFVERFMAPAGITGLWQIKKRGKAEMSAEERINLDITYARKASPMMDLWIMALTPSALFQKSNA